MNKLKYLNMGAIRIYLVSIFIFGLTSVDVAFGNHPGGPARVTSARVDIQTRNFGKTPTVPSSSSRLSTSVFVPSVGVGPQYGDPSRSVDRSQRVSPSPRRIIIMPAGTAESNRLSQLPGNLRRIHLPQSALQAFHRSAKPLRTSVEQPTIRSREKVPQNIAWLPSTANGQDILVRNLQVIDGTNPADSGKNSLSETRGSPSLQNAGQSFRTSLAVGEQQSPVSRSKQTNIYNLFPIQTNHNSNINSQPVSQANQNNNGNSGHVGNSNAQGQGQGNSDLVSVNDIFLGRNSNAQGQGQGNSDLVSVNDIFRGRNSNAQGQGNSDLVSINDIITLIDSIRNQGTQNPPPTQSSGIEQVGHAPQRKEPANALPALDTIQNLPMKTTRSGQGHGEDTPKSSTAASKSSSISKQKDNIGRGGPTGTTKPDPMLDMLVHFALMNANNERTDPLSSLISNPALLAQLIQEPGNNGRTGSTPSPFLPSKLPSKRKKEQTRRQSEPEENLSTQRRENPRPSKNPGRGQNANAQSGRRAARPNKDRTNKADPVPDSMFASLMHTDINGIREELQDQIRQQLTETEFPLGGSFI